MSDSSLPSGWRLWLSIPVALYMAILLCTRPVAYVDSMNYAAHIVAHSHGPIPAEGDPVWDFGHALWRPAALAIWNALRGPLTSLAPQEEVQAAVYAFIGMSVVGALVSIVLLFLIAARTTGKAWAAGITACGFAATAVVMNYCLTGTAYMTGGACQLAGLYLLSTTILDERITLGRTFLAGMLFGLSIGVWFPFILAMAGYLCFALFWSPQRPGGAWRTRIPFAVAMLAGIAVTVLVVYVWVMVKAGIGDLNAARAWMTRSRYGIEPTRGFLRVAAGIPRAFLWLGDAGSTWKRLLLEGRGFRGAAGSFLRTGGWKLLTVYAVLGVAAWRMWRIERHRVLLGCMLAIAIPLVLFAALLFDPSALERYYAAFPLLFLGFACLIAADRPGWFGRIVLPVFFGIMLVANSFAMARWNGDRGYENAIARLSAFRDKAGPNDAILVMNERDDAIQFLEARPFAPESRVRYLMTVVLPQGTVRTLRWKQEVAARVLDVWQHGGHAWLSLRLLAAEPLPEWNWVEGDDTRIHWADAPDFFRRLDLLDPFGGPDGFVEIAPSAANRELLGALAAH